MVLQQSLADLHRAYRNYFRAVAEVKAARARGEKAKLKVRKPKFKSKRHDQAIRVTRAGRHHVSFVVEIHRQPLPRAGREVGVDLGLTAFAALSTGEKVANPRWLRQREKALRRSQRAMSR